MSNITDTRRPNAMWSHLPLPSVCNSFLWWGATVSDKCVPTYNNGYNTMHSSLSTWIGDPSSPRWTNKYYTRGRNLGVILILKCRLHYTKLFLLSWVICLSTISLFHQINHQLVLLKITKELEWNFMSLFFVSLSKRTTPMQIRRCTTAPRAQVKFDCR